MKPTQSLVILWEVRRDPDPDQIRFSLPRSHAGSYAVRSCRYHHISTAPGIPGVLSPQGLCWVQQHRPLDKTNELVESKSKSQPLPNRKVLSVQWLERQLTTETRFMDYLNEASSTVVHFLGPADVANGTDPHRAIRDRISY